MQTKTKRLTTMAMLAAIAYIVLLLAHAVPFFAFIPSVPFLKYDPKDAIIAIAGFMLGPLPAAAITVVVSVIEMATISSTGIIGLVMNVLSTCAFVCPSAIIYKKRHTMSGAVIGLITGIVCMTIVMILWNYLITPLYMDVSREIIVTMLIPAFLPFNLIKAVANAALTLIIYKPVAKALRRGGLMPESSASVSKENARKFGTGSVIVGLIALATCVLVILAFNGVI